MTYAERHAATLEAVGKMKFSESFVRLMTTPYAKQALERGEVCHDDVTGELLTEEWFERDKQKHIPIGVPNGGLLGFKLAEDGHSYEPISMPGMELRQVANGQEQRLQLEEGK